MRVVEFNRFRARNPRTRKEVRGMKARAESKSKMIDSECIF